MGTDIDWAYIHQEFPGLDFSSTKAVDDILIPYFARLREERHKRLAPKPRATPAPASGTEARRAETATKIDGSVHDGPVGEGGDAQPSNPESKMIGKLR